jgi:hypothetical protein
MKNTEQNEIQLIIQCKTYVKHTNNPGTDYLKGIERRESQSAFSFNFRMIDRERVHKLFDFVRYFVGVTW